MATLKVYGKALDHLADADVDWVADTIKVALVASTYTPDQDTHDFFDDVDQDEISGTGYTTGGATLGNKTRTYDSGTNKITLDADDITTDWTSASFTARYAVIYKSRGGAASADELIGWVDFGGDQTVSGGTFSIAWNAAGLVTLTTT